MGKGLEEVKIDLPFEAQMYIRKCMNRGLILTRKGEVFEMQVDKKYKIDKDCNVLSSKIDQDSGEKTQ